MTVKELIEELQELSPKHQDATVLAFSDSDWYDGSFFTPICEIEIELDDKILLKTF